ncbi:MAG: PAS domain-containing protein, partial [Bacteroidales bacterium]|nr:PAS domain-containing protein [Bacteroidales bacterium]
MNLVVNASQDTEGATVCRVVMSDITKRKSEEEELQLSRERLEESQRIAKIGNWEADLSTGELYWSDVIYDIFGFDSNVFKPSVKAFYKAVHPDDIGLVFESEKRSEQTGVHDVIHRIVRTNGEVR